MTSCCWRIKSFVKCTVASLIIIWAFWIFAGIPVPQMAERKRKRRRKMREKRRSDSSSSAEFRSVEVKLIQMSKHFKFVSEEISEICPCEHGGDKRHEAFCFCLAGRELECCTSMSWLSTFTAGSKVTRFQVLSWSFLHEKSHKLCNFKISGKCNWKLICRFSHSSE